MTRRLKAVLGGLSLAFGLAGSAAAAPVQWTVASGGNDHWYEFVAGAITWTAARAAATGSTHQSMPGYLATVTSAAEDAFLGSLSGLSAWLGGSDAAVEGEWRWMDGPEAGQLFWQGGPGGTASGYASWNNGEPNNAGEEDYLDRQSGVWNDLPDTPLRGYFVEFNPSDPNRVPVSGTFSLLALSLAGLAAVRRRAR